MEARGIAPGSTRWEFSVNLCIEFCCESFRIFIIYLRSYACKLSLLFVNLKKNMKLQDTEGLMQLLVLRKMQVAQNWPNFE